jgi:hypothetical protein
MGWLDLVKGVGPKVFTAKDDASEKNSRKIIDRGIGGHQELHGLHLAELAEDLAQDPDAVEVGLAKEQLLLASAGGSRICPCSSPGLPPRNRSLRSSLFLIPSFFDSLFKIGNKSLLGLLIKSDMLVPQFEIFIDQNGARQLVGDELF